MISKNCFVYIQMPNSFEVIIVGRFEWQNSGANSDIGTFVYGKNYLSNHAAIPLDPFQLPLESRIFQNYLNDGMI